MATDETHDLDVPGEVAAITASIGRIAAHRDAVAHAARGQYGSQAGHRLSAQARKLSGAVIELSAGLLRLRDAFGDPGDGMAFGHAQQTSLPDRQTSQGQPVHGSFEIAVGVSDSGRAPETMTVWPGKPLVQVMNEALLLHGLAEQSGTWALYRRGAPGPVQEATIGEARIQPLELLWLGRVGVGDA